MSARTEVSLGKNQMIRVVMLPETKVIMESLAIPEYRVIETVNDRHRGLADEGATRLVAAHWFSDGQIVYVDSTVSKRRVEIVGQERRTSLISGLLRPVTARALPAA
ncbi:MAG TPA: hypothetical protein VFB66_25125 [Tepidisphaeraceae bacterium]|nr:hypothetical protein [Tepidisphaeraceae bacterium]